MGNTPRRNRAEADVIQRVEALPDRYADRVGPQDLDGMRSMADGGEWQELMDLLIASLNVTRAPVTADERNEAEVRHRQWICPLTS